MNAIELTIEAVDEVETVEDEVELVTVVVVVVVVTAGALYSKVVSPVAPCESVTDMT